MGNLIQMRGIPHKLSQNEATKHINQASTNTSNVLIGPHAKERMTQRSIILKDLYRILREGEVVGIRKSEKGDWCYKVEYKQLYGDRNTNAAITIILKESNIFVVTVY